MSLRHFVLALGCLAVAAGCVPAGGGGGFGGGSSGGGSRGTQSALIVGTELQNLFSDGSVFIEWEDDYAECGFFARDGRYDYDGYFRERGVYYDEISGSDQWYVSGDRICVGEDCFFAEWSGDLVYLSSHTTGYGGYAEIFDGPGFYYDNCGLV